MRSTFYFAIAGFGFPAVAAAQVPRPDHVVIVVEENYTFSSIIGAPDAPYLNALAEAGALFIDSHALQHPSQPNYLDLFSGSNQGVTNDSCPNTFTAPNLADSLIKAGLTFGGYSEDLPRVGFTGCGHDEYARRHSPWVNFTNVPESVNLPFTAWPTDFSTLPTVSFVIPNLVHDMHDGTLEEGDRWLRENLDSYRQWAMTHNSLLIITWDEDDWDSDNQITTIFAGQLVNPGHYTETINHFSVLRTIEDMYGLPAIGESANATAITGVWLSSSPEADCNQNGVADRLDLASSTSTDENRDLIPDDCQTVQGNLELVPQDPGCVLVVLQSNLDSFGGRLSLAYDPREVVLLGVTKMNLPSRAVIRVDEAPANSCSPGEVAAGFTLTWIDHLDHKSLTHAGRREILRICFGLPPGKSGGLTSPLRFVNCLGLPGSPARNMIMDTAGHYQFIPTRDGAVTVADKPRFRRGDVNDDRQIDTSDVVGALSCLFLGEICPACPAAMDADGDEEVGLTDAIYLLLWQFLGGEPPPPPFPDCGLNESRGPLAACEQPASCP